MTDKGKGSMTQGRASQGTPSQLTATYPASSAPAARQGFVLVGGAAQAPADRVAASRAGVAVNARPPAPGPEIRAAEASIVSARMTGAGLQAKTVAAVGMAPKTVEHVALEIDDKGGVRIERSEVMALFDPSACAVMRLAADDIIDSAQVRAALRFAWAGDRVMGEARIRTVDMDRVSGVACDGLTAAEIDTQARDDWNVAMILLMKAEFRVLDGVMRRDESSARAAVFAYPRFKDRKKLQGMGDQAIISATERLALEYGYKARNEPLVYKSRFR